MKTKRGPEAQGALRSCTPGARDFQSLWVGKLLGLFFRQIFLPQGKKQPEEKIKEKLEPEFFPGGKIGPRKNTRKKMSPVFFLRGKIGPRREEKIGKKIEPQFFPQRKTKRGPEAQGALRSCRPGVRDFQSLWVGKLLGLFFRQIFHLRGKTARGKTKGKTRAQIFPQRKNRPEEKIRKK